MYLVYLIKCDNLSYIGMTNDFTHRIRQHNQEIKGGAKYTKKKKNWYPICIIDGFPDMRSACQCEWRLKHLAKRGTIRNVNDRMSHLSNFISDKDKKWTSRCLNNIQTQNLTFYIDDEYVKDFLRYDHKYIHKQLYWK